MHPRTAERIQRNAAWFEGEERPLQEKDMKRSVYLYSATAIAGALFTLDDEGIAAKLKEGWYDSPADVPGNNAVPAPPVAVCPHCGKAIEGGKADAAAPVGNGVPAGGEGATTALLTKFKDGKKLSKAELAALGVELGLELVPDELTVKQMTEEIQAFLDVPALGGQ